MKQKFLDDSYDLVKRFLAQTVNPIATIYAHPKFVPEQMREKYTKLTTIPILSSAPDGQFGILLDPDTGISLSAKTLRHASLQCIIDLNREWQPSYVICYGQSYHRKHARKLNPKEQRKEKMRFLRKHSLPCFYYVSHAPFLFAAQKREVLASLLKRLMAEGIPKERFERYETID